MIGTGEIVKSTAAASISLVRSLWFALQVNLPLRLDDTRLRPGYIAEVHDAVLFLMIHEQE